LASALLYSMRGTSIGSVLLTHLIVTLFFRACIRDRRLRQLLVTGGGATWQDRARQPRGR